MRFFLNWLLTSIAIAIATFLVTWYNYFSRRFFLEGARS